MEKKSLLTLIFCYILLAFFFNSHSKMKEEFLDHFSNEIKDNIMKTEAYYGFLILY